MALPAGSTTNPGNKKVDSTGRLLGNLGTGLPTGYTTGPDNLKYDSDGRVLLNVDTGIPTGSLTPATRVLLEGPVNAADPQYAGGIIGDGTLNIQDSAAIQAAVTAAQNAVGGGGRAFIPRSLCSLYGGSILVAPAKSLEVLGEGIGATVLRCEDGGPSNSGRRAFDANKGADHDVFQHLAFRHLTVDGNSKANKGHVVFGNYRGGTFDNYLSLNDIEFDHVQTINVVTDKTNTIDRLVVAFKVVHAGAGEATQDYIKNVRFIDCDFMGGGNAGADLTASPSGVNAFIDRIKIIRSKHSCGSVQANPGGQNNWHVGGYGFGGSLYVEDSFGEYSCDTGFDLDSMTNIIVVNSRVKDCANVPFYFPNFVYPSSFDDGLVSSSGHTTRRGQRIILDNCRADAINVAPNGVALSGAFSFDGAQAAALGSVVARDCTYYRSFTGATQASEAVQLLGTIDEAAIDVKAVLDSPASLGAGELVPLSGPTVYSAKASQVTP